MGEGKDAVDVKLTRGFWMGKYEVTQGAYRAVTKPNPSRFSAGPDTDEFPVENVSWDDASEFCRALTEVERLAGRLPPEWEYRLPAEAQWEYACRAGTQTVFSFGDRESQLSEYG